ncbi:ABC-type sugar transport system, periplasmic component [Thermobacillus composti KWC4]|jgi:putative aldouronate transport system substrate-binding protein|uniref:ABC-type sugar transport system, periplasmic component n=1 Tax=Thermobacillus composti (strain DSM 18247 / JCM 13945 / KWC4) TaxID=717605 RepID=L0EC86_THECK|nr:extracellular solute-binding protein [Thermobacillus composti]AGA57397.1 ABC-type sugar transport system, periplasmic component [Thermobacillus composti KWC4]
MNKWKRFAILGVALMLLFSAAACSSGSKNNGGSASSSGSDSGSPGETAEIPTIKILTTDLAKVAPEDPSKDRTVQYMEEKSGVDLDITFIANANYQEQVQLKFAANEKFDAFLGTGLNSGAASFAREKLLPLNDLIDQYGPNLKKNIPQEAWDAVTVDGQILGIPQPSYVQSSRILYVRQDWMDKLGMTEYPKTSGEFLDMLRAFRDNDMNGNGDNSDELPFSTRQGFNWVMDPIWGMWGLSPLGGYEYNGEVVPGFAHPRFKEPLRLLQTMYQEGLLDSEFLTNSSSIWAQKFESGRVGVLGFQPESAWAFHKRIYDNAGDPNVNLMAMPTPRGEGWDGPVGAEIYTIARTYHVTTDSKNPEAVIKFFDWVLSEEGQIFTELGIEGLNYTIDANGNIVYDAESEAREQTEWRDVFRMHGFNETAFAAKYPGEQGEKLRHAYDISASEGFRSLTVDMPPLDQELQNILENSFQEKAAEIVVNNLPVDETWDKFIETWRKQGGDRLIEAMTTWYNENKS